MGHSSFSIVIAGLITAIAGMASAGTPVAVTACGQRYTGDGFLVGDLDCTGDDVSGVPAVTITRSGSLDLRGFTITGGTDAVRCEDSCRVFNGTISSGGSAGVTRGRVIAIADLTIIGRSVGVAAIDRITAERATLLSNWNGLWCSRGSVKMTDTTISNGTRLDGSEFGVIAGTRAILRSSSVSGMLLSGVVASRAVLSNSGVTGSATDSECNVSKVCADLYTWTKPRLRASTCDTSTVASTNEMPSNNPDWDACSLD